VEDETRRRKRKEKIKKAMNVCCLVLLVQKARYIYIRSHRSAFFQKGIGIR